ncbi:ComEC/Rec2 family competence protein [Stakelama saccharophila]|uniref:ComEC/Rec2 family competence protein n=1 Tax=Stakelama saccharophila TaxID=3075605 RepID=A0ABZ0B606_9SPHN|nr:ComEC/Rec2 family competence protein [Stakelama sp. W311]WNO52591.1 ComEC/Rec2 family competence protein [Stakelama sp. W311]
MASSAAPAPSTGLGPHQFAGAARIGAVRDSVECWLDAERDQLPVWLPVAIGGGIAAWFLLPYRFQWIGFCLGTAGVGLAALAAGRGGRISRVLAVAAFALALGCALVWWRAERVAAPVLDHAGVARVVGVVEKIERIPARDIVRLRLAVRNADLPPVIRMNVAEQDVPAGLGEGAIIKARGWLMPPPPAAVPGAYDFTRVAWFDGIGATGRAFAPVTVTEPGQRADDTLRSRLSRYVRERVGGSAGALAATLATGDRGAIAEDDAEAMRNAGLAHLLSISGLHVTAVVGAVMLLVLRGLALFPTLAGTGRIPVIAAGAGAAAAVGYTWLTGAHVPTIRSCVAALLIVAAIVFGRQAITLRLVAAGALLVLLLWPETLVGPSFQLSFAAVTVIVALHEHPVARRWFSGRDRDDRWPIRFGRAALSLLVTGIVVELALMPIAFYHFHRAGLYGAAANILAIPLTTFVIMPAEAVALLLDLLRLGAPAWWVAGEALGLLLKLAHATASAPGAIAALPVTPTGAFAAIVLGGLWTALWRTGLRWIGLVSVAVGLAWALITPPPDLLVSADGTHMALRKADGSMALLRDRSGDYIRDVFRENGGSAESLTPIDAMPNARCSHDSCLIDYRAGDDRWRILATRSDYLIPRESLEPACRDASIIVSDRWLPRWCRPRWLKLDAKRLAATGGVAINFADHSIRTAVTSGGDHPWIDPPTIMPPYRPDR